MRTKSDELGKMASSLGLSVAALAGAVAVWFPSTFFKGKYSWVTLAALILSAGLLLASRTFVGTGDRHEEAQARERVHQAEVSLAKALEAAIPVARSPDQEEPSQNERPDDRLALAALWTVTHERLDLYHRIATGQARRSFVTAQVAMMAGFILLVAFAIFASSVHSTAAAITTGGLGAVAAAFAGYIGRTFVRSQESAASHLRAYFDQPLEFSKYLAAERLLAATDNLTSAQQAKIVGALIQAIATPILNYDGKEKA